MGTLAHSIIYIERGQRSGGPCRHTSLPVSCGSTYSTVGYRVLRKLPAFAGTAFNYPFAFPQTASSDFPGTAGIAYPAAVLRPARSPPVSEHWNYRKHCFYNGSVLRRATSAPMFESDRLGMRCYQHLAGHIN